MKLRHDARLLVTALSAYVSAALVTGEVVSGGAVRLMVMAAMGAALVAAVLATCGPVQGGIGRSVCAHVLLGCAAFGVVGWVSDAHVTHRWQGGFDQVVGSGAPRVELEGTAVREPTVLAASGFDGELRVRLEVAVTKWRFADAGAGPQGGTDSQGDAGSRGGAVSRDADTTDNDWRGSAATVVVVGTDALRDVAYGDTVTLATQLTAVHARKEVAMGWGATLVAWQEGTGQKHWVASVREQFRYATRSLSTQVRGLTRGMVIGDTRDMPQGQREVMRVTGLTHLTAVSGAHFAVVAVVLHYLLRRIRLGRLARAVAAAAGMGVFAALVFPDPSVVRALVMALVGAIAVWWGRPAQALPALCWTVIVLVIVDPYVALEVGFVLSICAVAAIVLWAPRLRVVLGRYMPPMPAMLISVPVAAQAACAPILILLEPRVSMYAVVANLVAAPFAAPVTVLGLVTVLLGPLWPALATAGAWVVSLAVWPVAWVAQVTSSLPGATVAWPPGVIGAGLLTAMTAMAMWWTVPRGRRMVKATLSALIVVMTVLVAQSQSVWGWVNPPPSQWAIVACDVGQGDMMLLHTAPGSAVVIDTGPGDGTAQACLARFGIRHVPLLILTHPHADHDGGVAEVLLHADVHEAWVPAVALEPGLDGAVRMLAQEGVGVGTPPDGTNWRGGSVSLTVRQGGAVAAGGRAAAAGNPTSVPDPKRFSGTELNDDSLVVSGTAKGVTVLALGDVESQAQHELARRIASPLLIDVVKIPHHGSRTQDPELVGELIPGVAVVSSGAHNTYGHPATSALDLYERTGAVVVRTDQCADIAIWRDPQLRLASDCQ